MEEGPQKRAEELEIPDIQVVSQEVSVWDVVGNPPSGLFFRFGDVADQVMFRLMRVVSTIDAVWVPVLLSFGELQWLRALTMHPLCLLIDFALNFVYGLGVLMQMRTSVVQLAVAQEWVHPSAIFMLRMKSPLFWMDFLSVFGAFWWNPSLSNNIAALRIFRLWRLSAGADDLYELHLAELTSEDAVKNFVQLLWQLVLVIHCFACSWFFATTMSLDNWQRVLQDDPRFLGGDIGTLYLIYFSQGAAMLAGWGGPAAISPDGIYSRCEYIVWSITAPSSTLCTAWVFAQLLEVIAQASAATDKHLTKLAELSSVLESLFVPPQLKQRCLRYHSFLSIHNANKAEYDELFSSMSMNLQKDIKVHLFDRLIRTAPFFAQVPEKAMTTLVLAFEEEVYGPGQYIFHEGEVGDELYFIMRGSVEVLKDISPVAELHEGQFFGELALVLDQPRGASIRAKHFCMFAKLTRELFLEIFEEDTFVKESVMNEIARRGIAASPKEMTEEEVKINTPLLSPSAATREDQSFDITASATGDAAFASFARPDRESMNMSGFDITGGMTTQISGDPVSPTLLDDTFDRRDSNRGSMQVRSSVDKPVTKKGRFADKPVRSSTAKPEKSRSSMGRSSVGEAAGEGANQQRQAAADKEQVDRLVGDLARLGLVVDRFQSKFESVEARLRNMEGVVAGASPLAGRRAG